MPSSPIITLELPRFAAVPAHPIGPCRPSAQYVVLDEQGNRADARAEWSRLATPDEDSDRAVPTWRLPQRVDPSEEKLRGVRLQASLLCSLDTEKFVLTLKAEKEGATVFEEPILETKPDEIIFAHQFKEVVLEGETIVVKSKFGKPTFSLQVSSLG